MVMLEKEYGQLTKKNNYSIIYALKPMKGKSSKIKHFRERLFGEKTDVLFCEHGP